MIGPVVYRNNTPRLEASKVKNLAEAHDRESSSPVIVETNEPTEQPAPENSNVLAWETDEDGQLVHFDVVV